MLTKALQSKIKDRI